MSNLQLTDKIAIGRNSETYQLTIEDLSKTLEGQFIPVTGGTCTGTINFDGNGTKLAAGSAVNLTGRCSLLLNSAADLPIGVASGSSNAKILSLYGYDNSEDDDRREVFTFQANGYSRFKGKLRITPESGNALEVREPSTLTTFAVSTEGKVVIKSSLTGNDYIFAIYPTGLDSDNNKVGFRVTADGKVKAGHDANTPFMATDANDVVTKKYLEDELSTFDPSVTPDMTNYVLKAGDTMTGALEMESDIKLYNKKAIYFYKDKSTKSLEVYGYDNDQVRFNSPWNKSINFTGKTSSSSSVVTWLYWYNGKTYIHRLREPTSNSDAATKKYVDERPSVISVGSGTPSGVVKGSMWYNTSDKTLYVKIS